MNQFKKKIKAKKYLNSFKAAALSTKYKTSLTNSYIPKLFDSDMIMPV